MGEHKMSNLQSLVKVKPFQEAILPHLCSGREPAVTSSEGTPTARLGGGVTASQDVSLLCFLYCSPKKKNGGGGELALTIP